MNGLIQVSKYNPEQEEPKHRRKRGKRIKKPFAIEYRVLGSAFNKREQEWRIWARYETRESLEQAIKKLETNHNNSIFAKGSIKFEYRIVDNDDE